MDPSALTELTIADAAARIAARDITPLELTEAYLERIQRLNPLLNAYITVTADAALAEARAATEALASSGPRSLLHGIPIALKDIYATKGVRTTAGSKILADYVPARDATVTWLLRRAGAVLLGKLNTHEFAYGVTNNNPHYGPARNPWDTSRIPGGSSGGSAIAVAAGMAAMAMGSDTGGSIRVPAALCGVVGLKPTYGRVSTAGLIPLSWSLDHAGPLARTVEDAAIVLQAIAGPDPADPATPPVPLPDYRAAVLRGREEGLSGVKLAVPRVDFFETEAGVGNVIAAALDVLRDLGATLEDVETPALVRGRPAVADIMLAEARHYHATWLRERPNDYGAAVLARLTRRENFTADELIAAFRTRDAAIRETEALLTRYDALVLPTTRFTAPPIENEPRITVAGRSVLASEQMTLNTNPFNLTMMPAISVPCGFTSAGLPVGLQIATRRWNEPAVLRIAAAYEAATPWHKHHPPLPL
jgi:aspartyl-tRNA(Asn)/glutamyl-tRNA(Gln) amidotransferase subunit A